MASTKTRKATRQQMVAFLAAIENNTIIRYGKGDVATKKQAWDDIALHLNSLGGAFKTADQWKQAYTVWKSHIRQKLREGEVLNDLDDKCAQLAGLREIAEGQKKIHELGFDKANMENTVCTSFVIEEDGTLSQIEDVVKEDNNTNNDSDGDRITVNYGNQEENINTDESQQQSGKPAKPITIKTRKLKQVKSKQTPKRYSPKSYGLQYEMYLIFKETKKDTFENFCEQINKVGPFKSVKQWKQVFMEWESKTKSKARRIHLEQQRTGGGIGVNEFLNELELRLLALLSKILLYGNPNVTELGFIKKTLSSLNYYECNVNYSAFNRITKNNSVRYNELNDSICLKTEAEEVVAKIIDGLRKIALALENIYKALKNVQEKCKK
ncbi:hypothetical protein FQR65_LT15670 [Abscondita terminalis]|nr:hypothetical protein FQR65_LT15670 [Abscondita terminalis]